MPECPICQGKGKLTVFVNTGFDSSQHYNEVRICNRCLGGGYVSQNIIVQIERSKQLRAMRIAKGLSLKEVALAEGVSISTVSQRELGML